MATATESAALGVVGALVIAILQGGMSWRQFDLSAIVIKVLEKLKLVSNVKTPSPQLVERRRKGAIKPEGAIGD